MRYFGAWVFGAMTLLATAGVVVFFMKTASEGKGGGVMALLVSPILWLVLAGPCALLFLVFFLRSFRR